MDGVICVIKTVLETSSCIVNLQQLVPHFNRTKDFLVFISEVSSDTPEKPQVRFVPSQTLLDEPTILKEVTLQNLQGSWRQVSLLMQHFHINNTHTPVVNSNKDVYDDLTSVARFDTTGLKLLAWSPVSENKTDRQTSDSVRGSLSGTKSNAEASSGKHLFPFRGMETVTSLVLHEGTIREKSVWELPPIMMENMFARNITIPRVLQDYLWPELSYVELEVTDFMLTDILALNITVPNLSYLKLYVPFGAIPEIVWTFDWDSLPWSTGFVVVYSELADLCTENVNLNLANRITSHQIPPIHFYDAVNRYYTCLYIQFHLDIDFSENAMESLGFFQFTFWEDFNIRLNISNNNLYGCDVKERFHVIENVIYPKQECDVLAKVRMLDLSYNYLNYFSMFSSDFLLLKQLNELYLHHNDYTSLPTCSSGSYQYQIKDLRELRTLDMSHNSLDYYIIWDDLSYDDFSTLREIDFHNNSIPRLPSFVFQARYFTSADFSGNQVTFEGIWPWDMTVRPKRLERTVVYLGSNRVEDLDLAVLEQSEFNNLHNVLENFDLHLNGNQINCSCATHRMYNYLTSSSKSERHMDGTNLPDFRFYETKWKCRDPQMWAGTPLMQVSEYEYSKMCVPSLKNCSNDCYCYYSWLLNEVIVADCSHSKDHAHNELPEKLPEDTSELILANNDVQILCGRRPYLTKLKILDISRNRLSKICTDIFQDLDELRELNLANNALKAIPSQIEELINLTKLYITNNMVEELPKSIKTLEHLELVEISGNPFRCDCDTIWMTEWILKSFSIVQNPYSVLCVSGQGRGKRLVDLNQDDLGCPKDKNELKYALIGLTTVFVVTIVIIILINRYKGYIKIWLYTRFGFHPWDQVEENLEEKDYDAFVSYCNKDLKWVARTLLPYLEAPQCGFHLCVHERDFVPGVAITKNIMTAIQCSRRTILVLSPNFIKSGWCDLEFQAAHQRALEDRSNFLIVVVLQEVDSKDLDETLRLYMKTKTYVSANDKWFWQKMLYALPEVPIDQIKQQQSTENQINMQNIHFDDLASNSSDEEEESDKVYRRRKRQDFVASLPPLFKRINTYNN